MKKLLTIWLLGLATCRLTAQTATETALATIERNNTTLKALQLTADAEKYPELPERLARECPDAALILSSPKPEAFHSAYARAVLRKPFHKEDFLAAIQDIKNSK